MCDRKNCQGKALYSIPRIGKVCLKCKKEFALSLIKKNPSEKYLKEALDLFLAVEKKEEDEAVNQFFSRFLIK